MKRIAIQGSIGSFHDIAAHQYFKDEQIQLICCSTFEQVFENIKHDPTVIGMLAIENTIAGSLLHNYELLRDSGTTIVGEHKLHIEHSICCLPEDSCCLFLFLLIFKILLCMFSIFASLRLPAYSDFLQKKQRLQHPLSVNDAADLSLHRVTVLDSGFATLCFHKCALIGVILSGLGSLVNRLYPNF